MFASYLQVALQFGHDLDSMKIVGYRQELWFHCRNIEETSLVALLERGYFNSMPSYP